MFGGSDYRETALKNEDIFRKILKDLKNNKNERPMGMYVPDDLNIDESIEEIYKHYSEGIKQGVFSILNFSIEENVASISFKDVAFLSGGGAELKYDIDSENNVQYKGTGWVMMS